MLNPPSLNPSSSIGGGSSSQFSSYHRSSNNNIASSSGQLSHLSDFEEEEGLNSSRRLSLSGLACPEDDVIEDPYHHPFPEENGGGGGVSSSSSSSSRSNSPTVTMETSPNRYSEHSEFTAHYKNTEILAFCLPLSVCCTVSQNLWQPFQSQRTHTTNVFFCDT